MLKAGLRISVASLLWTLVAGATAIALGATSDSLVLVVFGAIGLLDAVGSAVLIVHFRHALRHEAISEPHERVALAVVTIGMAVVGAATMIDSALRLAEHAGGRAPALGVALAAASAAVLAALSAAKRRIAPRVPSRALLADGWLSGVGAVLALVTLAGTGLEAGLGWWWLDPAAALVVGAGAIAMSVALRHRSARPARVSLPSIPQGWSRGNR